MSQVRSPAKWLEEINKGTPLTQSLEPLSLIQCVREMLMMGLRLTDGVNKNGFKARLNFPLKNFLNTKVLAGLLKNDLVVENAESLRLTSKGRALINPILDRLLP